MDFLDKYEEHIASYALTVQCYMNGDQDSEIVVVGDTPSAQDCSTNVTFSGGTGNVLWNALRQHKIVRPQCYTTFAVKRQVSAKESVHVDELALWQDALMFELSQLKNVKLIIACGQIAMHMLTGFDKIKDHRGSVYSTENGIPIVIADNPLSTLRMPETAIVFEHDIAKAIRVLNGDYEEMIIRKIINPSFEEAMGFMRHIRKHKRKVSIDIELTGTETACIGLAISKHEAMCINLRDAKKNRFTVEQEYRLLRCFAAMVDDPDVFIIAQNGNFDSHFMGFKDHVMFKVDFDTLLAHHTMYPRLPHNLGFLTSQYVDLPYYKDDVDIFKEGGDIDLFWGYNCTDCCVTYAVHEEELTELKEQELDDFFFNHVMRLQPHLSESTVTGVKVDMEKKESLNNVLSKDVDKLRIDVIKAGRIAARDPELVFNPGSSKQVTSLLFKTLKLKHATKAANKTVRDNLLADARVPLDAKNLLTKLGTYGEEKKYLSTYVETIIDPDNRFRADFKQFGVSKAPGRLSSSKTLWGTGGNAQNQPHRAYEMYQPDDGCVFIYFDLAQAEARYVAWDANIESWMTDFERARLDGTFDAHRSLAATMFKMPYDTVPTEDWLDAEGRSMKDPNCDMSSLVMTKRFIAKRCRHGLNYRMHIARLAQTTGMSYTEAASNYYTYHRTTPELKEWWTAVEREIRKKRMMYNCYGRRFIALERLENSNIMDSIIAFKPQSSIGDKTQRVWYQSHEDPRWDKRKARICLNIHDALYGIATPAFAKTALSIMKKYAEEPLMIKQTVTNKVLPMIIPADCKMSYVGEDGHARMSTMKDVDIQCAA